MTRRARIAITVGLLIGVQAAALVIYLAVERSRSRSPSTGAVSQRITDTEPAPTIAAKRRDGSVVTLTWPAGRARIVHFWATWCEPCREELPSLLALAREQRGVEVVAIAVDDKWQDIAAFFAGAVPPEVVIEETGVAHKRFGVSTLPDTYLVNRSGKLVERYQGARDWKSSAMRARVLGATGGE
jgi:thiol-disulfide isomerase/thioredoxin